MTEVAFHFNVPDKLHYTCRLLRKARAALQAVTRDDVRAILRKLTLSVSYLLTKEVDAHAAE